MKFSDKANYRTILHQMYETLYRQNVAVDFVFPESTNLSDYKVIVVPPLYVASDEVLNRLVDYVHGGGHLVMAFKSGFTNEYDTVRWAMAPGPLRKAAGFRYQEFSSLAKPLALKDDPFKAGADNKVSDLGGDADPRRRATTGVLRPSILRQVPGHHAQPFRQAVL